MSDASAPKRKSDYDIVAETPHSVAFPDEVEYHSGGLGARLRLHDTSSMEFRNQFLAAAGGSCHPDDGGNWDRLARASAFLREREPNAMAKERLDFGERYLALSPDEKDIVKMFAVLAGITRPPRHTQLTTGELAYYEWAYTYARSFVAEGDWEKVVAGFDLDRGEDRCSASTAVESPGEASLQGPPTASPGELPKVVARMIEPDIVLPEGYTDEVPEGLTVSETKDLIYSFVHKILMAELSRARPRKAVIDFCASKCQGFKIPDEWRKGEAA